MAFENGKLKRNLIQKMHLNEGEDSLRKYPF